jgi:aspartate/methionine/tyrosine aminotransferase
MATTFIDTEITKEAEKLNETIALYNPHILKALTAAGLRLFFPEAGILAQSQAANKEATKRKEAGEKFYNGTIGVSFDEKGVPFAYGEIRRLFKRAKIALSSILYSPSSGLKSLRKLLKEQVDIPGIQEPIITSGLTHSISDIATMFCDEKTAYVTHDMFWENIQLTNQTIFGAKLETYPFYNEERNGFNLDGMVQAIVDAHKRDGLEKVVLYLNFPNNPTGYNLTEEEGKLLREKLQEVMEKNPDLVLTVVCDEAYHGLSYDNATEKPIMSYLVNLHERALVLGAKGPTKDVNVWGLRVGALYVLPFGMNPDVIEALNQKFSGATRGLISMASHLSQVIVQQIYESKSYLKDRFKIKSTMSKRAKEIKRVYESDPDFKKFMPLNPFNSGYFCSFRVNNPELVWHELLKAGVGLIAGYANNDPKLGGEGFLRFAFSGMPKKDIEAAMRITLRVVKEFDGPYQDIRRDADSAPKLKAA